MTHEIDEEDQRAFREAVRGVLPLAHGPRVARRARPRPSPSARFRRLEAAAVLEDSITLSPDELEVEPGDALHYRKHGVQDTVMRKLRRGQYRMEAELDLHGMVLAEAKPVLRDFLARCIARQLRCVRIVHGKGLRSGTRGPVLKNAVNVILRRTAAVTAFCSARQVDGGTGAIYVLLAG